MPKNRSDVYGCHLNFCRLLLQNGYIFNAILECTMPPGGNRTQCGPMQHYTQQTNQKDVDNQLMSTLR